ncbi:hypothetical protein CK203_008646 [Vitis vinifera]|uniref:DUF659 domain-containing protein n=1 Tax=Vitis vinifera TaxID=29760 RepID=A0A438KD03_VITVI|nr:hypothetical protein CK203_008646 [Vitis vinifera]
MNMGSENVNEDLFDIEDEDFGEEINSRMNVTNIYGGEMVVQNRRSGKMNQTTINDAYKKSKRKSLYAYHKWMYEAAIPFNAVTYPSFQPMIEAIGQYGVGMKGPTFMREVVRIKAPHLYWTPCAAHCLDLMLEDIGKLPNIKRTLERAISLNGFGSLVRVLRLVDGEKKAPMGYIYEAMNRAKDTIVRSFNGNEEKYKEIFNIIDKRWRFSFIGLCMHARKSCGRSEFVHKCPRTIRNELAVRTRRLEQLNGGLHMELQLQICKVCNESPQLNMQCIRATGAEEARFDTRARARASSSIIPPRG